jgi:transcriptional regulator with XRE-family HTH domain
MLDQFQHARERVMATQMKTYPIIEGAIDMFGEWLKHQREKREMREMNSVDFARIARDLSVSPAELDAVVRQGPHASEELPKLLKILGIDEATLSRVHPVLQRDMVRVCAACQKKARCNHDLNSGTLAQTYDAYCPNAPAIDELMQKS